MLLLEVVGALLQHIMDGRTNKTGFFNMLQFCGIRLIYRCSLQSYCQSQDITIAFSFGLMITLIQVKGLKFLIPFQRLKTFIMLQYWGRADLFLGCYIVIDDTQELFEEQECSPSFGHYLTLLI